MKKFNTPAKRRKQASPKLHLVRRKADIETENQISDGEEKYNQIKHAIDAYYIEYTLPGRQLTRPGLNSSSVDVNFVCLRCGNVLLAIYNISSGRFLHLTSKLIHKYSK